MKRSRILAALLLTTTSSTTTFTGCCWGLTPEQQQVVSDDGVDNIVVSSSSSSSNMVDGDDDAIMEATESEAALLMKDSVLDDNDGSSPAAAEEEEETTEAINNGSSSTSTTTTTTSTTTSSNHNNNNNNNKQQQQQQQQRLWGAAAPTTNTEVMADDDDDDDDDTNNVSASHTTTTTTTLHSSSSPLPNISMSKRHKPEYIPPAGFSIAARVYIDPTDKLAHLDEDHHPAVVTLPYFDCGVTGSTTAPLPVRDATFRHSLTATTPFQGTDGKHPLLAIALTDLSIETNSGDRQDIRAGQAILLEDVLAAGHKLLPMAHQELQVLFLTLPQTHYHPGKDRLSLHKQSSSKSTLHPCPLPDGDGTTHPLLSSRRRPTDLRHIRRAVLGALGLSLSALMADFLAKTAPLWLAVGVGGTCFVAAGTAAVVLGGEALWANLEYALEQRRLQSTTTTTTTTSKKRQKNNASPSEMPQES
mmetsp:Transcript_9568/g.26433  ORF Transcript_9568/g.26433 Transcript_9568/m.26433 type:complete len:474 (+) Transcript_9568:113-1534(+)